MDLRVPRRSWQSAALAVAAVVALLALAPGAAAAKRTVPVGFWGVNWNGEITFNSGWDTRVLNWQKMADSGVESARAEFLWSRAQPHATDPVDYTYTDNTVELAVTSGIQLLPVISGAPRWARQSDAPNSPPKNNGAYANFVRELIVRYGPEGSFWDENPLLTKRPIRAWQIFNEPSLDYQWTIPEGKDWAPGYGKLVRRVYPVVKDADPGAKVVLAGLPNDSYQDLEHLYKVGNIHGSFDVAALHPYTHHEHGVLTIAKRFRAVMKKYGDGKKQLWVTELGLPASKGKSKDKSSLQTTDSGMSKFLEQSYKDLTENREKLRVPKVYWYTWASSYRGWFFNYAGLRRFAHKGSQEVQVDKPALAVYAKLARRAQGR
jgi:polysaccharide biosynthesis protein PslG